MRMTKELRLCKIRTDLPVDKERTQSEDINMSRSRTSSGEYPAQNERSGIHGISEREKQPDDISEMGEYEICIDTVGKNTAAIKEYIANQLKKDKESEQLSIFDPRDPFTGSK